MQLFGSLWIGQKDSNNHYVNKTENQGKYIILPLNFGALREAPPSRNIQYYTTRFDEILLEQTKTCASKYGLNLGDRATDAGRALRRLHSVARSTPIYAFVDDYDAAIDSLVFRSAFSLEEKKKVLGKIIANQNRYSDASIATASTTS